MYQSKYRSVYNLTAHIVFVTEYRRRTLTKELLFELEEVFKSILETRECQLLEFNGEADHVHLLISYLPSIAVSNLVANLKSTASKQMWLKHSNYLKKFYWKNRVFWTGAYFVSSCGGVTIEQIRKYVENQNAPN